MLIRFNFYKQVFHHYKEILTYLDPYMWFMLLGLVNQSVEWVGKNEQLCITDMNFDCNCAMQIF